MYDGRKRKMINGRENGYHWGKAGTGPWKGGRTRCPGTAYDLSMAFIFYFVCLSRARFHSRKDRRSLEDATEQVTDIASDTAA